MNLIILDKIDQYRNAILLIIIIANGLFFDLIASNEPPFYLVYHYDYMPTQNYIILNTFDWMVIFFMPTTIFLFCISKFKKIKQ